VKLLWTDRAWDDYTHWLNADVKMVKRINELILDTRRHPFQGIGKPEPLRGEMAGWWSRRITEEHRLVYRVSGSGDAQALEIVSCRLHYKR
jgi:toxin YoeB